MKKKKVSEKENEWKGILQDNSKTAYLIPSNSRTPLECKVNTNLDKPQYNIHTRGLNMFEDKKCQDPEVANFYQVGESNVTPNNFTTINTNINGSIKVQTSDGKIENMNLDKIYVSKLPLFTTELKREKSWEKFTKDKKLQDTEEEYCNVGFNKDWENSKFSKNIKKIYEFTENDFQKWDEIEKDKRVDFEFTPLTFWQLLPSIAFNLHCNEIELTWLCFGMYINFKKNGN